MLAAVLVSSAGVQLQGIKREHQTQTKKQDVRSVVELLVLSYSLPFKFPSSYALVNYLFLTYVLSRVFASLRSVVNSGFPSFEL